MIFDTIAAWISGLTNTAAVAATPTVRRLYPGAVCQGTVKKVGPTWAIVSLEAREAFIPIREMSLTRLDSASQAMAEGQNVEIAILGPSEKKPDSWIGSLVAVAEARKRDVLGRLAPGQRLSGLVRELKTNGILLQAGGAELFVPLGELAWEPVDFPADVVAIGQELEVEVLRVSIPKWLSDGRKNHSSATASRRNCIPKPEARFIPMAFSALPFSIKARARRPANMDVVLMHVLMELAAGHTRDDISRRTHIPAAVVGAIVRQLESDGLVSGDEPTRQGSALVEAHDMAHELNQANFGGLYAAAAEPAVRLAGRDGRVVHPPYPPDALIPEYPPTWPRPSMHTRAEEAFLQLGPEQIQADIIGIFMDGEQRARLEGHLADKRLSITLARDGAHRSLCTYVTDHWLFAGLLNSFDAIGPRKPYHPEVAVGMPASLLMVKLGAFAGEQRLPQSIYLEPYSRTLWAERPTGQVRFSPLKEKAFPALPEVGKRGLKLGNGAIATRIEAEAWCRIHFRGAA